MSVQALNDSAESVDVSSENSQDGEVLTENIIPLNVFQRGANVALNNPIKSFAGVIAVAFCPAAVAAVAGASNSVVAAAAIVTEVATATVVFAGFALSNANRSG